MVDAFPAWLAQSAPLWAREHAIVLVIAAPLLAAAMTGFAPHRRVSLAIALSAAAASLWFAFIVLAQTQAQGVVSYDLGGWIAPLGIEYRADGLNAPVLLLIAAMGVLALIYAPATLMGEVHQERHALVYSAFLVCFAGLLGVVVTGDAFNLFVFLEISSLSTYVLVAMGAQKDRRALTAAFNYLVLGTIGATFFVIGVGFLYIATGTLNLVDMAGLLGEVEGASTVRAGFAFIVVGLGLKAAVYPLHLWLPNAYAFSPSFITAFLAATATKAALYALIRFLFSVFDTDFTFEAATLAWLFGPLAAGGMLIASVQASFQTDARRVFAYSSVAQVGYMLLGVSLGTAAGVAAGMLHLFNHALMKGALFMALGVAASRLDIRSTRDLNGLGRLMPVTFGALSLGGFSLIGVPLTAGFISKLYLFGAVAERGWWWAIAAIAVSSVLAFVYVGRILAAAYLQPAGEAQRQAAAQRAAPLTVMVPLLVLAGANVWFGVDAAWLEGLARDAAATILGPTADMSVEPLVSAPGAGGAS